MWKCVHVGVVLLVLVVLSAGEDAEKDAQDMDEKPEELKEEKVETSNANWTGHDLRLLLRKCIHKPLVKCVKLTMAQALEYLPVSGVQLAPGFTVLANSSDALAAAGELRSLLSADAPGVRVLTPLRQFLSGLTVRVKLEDLSLLTTVKSLSEEVVENLVTDGEIEGRKKGGGGAALWAAGAMAAAGFAALAAVAGKALMASMAALMMSALGAMRGGGGGGGGGGHKSHVEIIKAPAHYELAPLPVHDGGGYAFEHDHYHYP